jgi:hypothetical protein
VSRSDSGGHAPPRSLNPVRPEQAHEKLLGEIRSEKASALGRIARTLEGSLARLDVLRARAARSTCSHERLRLVRAFNEERRTAETWRWYLTVQREAIGFRRHDDLERKYPVPQRLRE